MSLKIPTLSKGTPLASCLRLLWRSPATAASGGWCPGTERPGVPRPGLGKTSDLVRAIALRGRGALFGD